MIERYNGRNDILQMSHENESRITMINSRVPQAQNDVVRPGLDDNQKR